MQTEQVTSQAELSLPFRVVAVDDDPSILRLLRRIIGDLATDMYTFTTGTAALDALPRIEWDLLLLDRQLPDADGKNICVFVKGDPRFVARQVIMITGCSTIEDKLEGYGVGADDYIVKPFQPVELRARVKAARRIIMLQKQLLEANRRLETLSFTDSLTGLPNRRYFESTFQSSFETSRRYGVPLSVGVIDLDRFKQINDQFGHPAGDAVLIEAGRRFRESVRASDVVSRYGGEEFVVLLPQTTLTDAVLLGDRLRTVLSDDPVEIDGAELEVTASVGTATIPHTSFSTTREMFAAADRALYRAKQNGRNRVEAERRRDHRRRTVTSSVARAGAARV